MEQLMMSDKPQAVGCNVVCLLEIIIKLDCKAKYTSKNSVYRFMNAMQIPLTLTAKLTCTENRKCEFI